MRVKLTYFKPSGKFYTEAEYVCSWKHAFEVFDEVKQMSAERRLPGLVDNHSPFITLVEANEQRALILP